MLSTDIVLNVKTKTKNNFCTQHAVNLYFSWNSMNNLSSYCGLTDARRRTSEKDLPVMALVYYFNSDPSSSTTEYTLTHTNGKRDAVQPIAFEVSILKGTLKTN